MKSIQLSKVEAIAWKALTRLAERKRDEAQALEDRAQALLREIASEMSELLDELKDNHGEAIPMSARVNVEGDQVRFVWPETALEESTK